MVNLLDERFVLGLVGISFVWASTNFEANLGYVFGIMSAIVFALYLADKVKKIRLESKRNLGKSLFLAVAGWIALIVSSLVTLSFLKAFFTISPASITAGSILEILAETQQTLALEGYIPLHFVFFGVFVPIIETAMIALLYELFSDYFKVNINKISINLISIWIALSTAFVIFHLAAKGITNFPALWMVFLFGMITCYLIFVERQYIGAVLFHVITNSIALSIKFNLVAGAFMAALYVIGGIVLFFLIINKFNIKNLKLLGG